MVVSDDLFFKKKSSFTKVIPLYSNGITEFEVKGGWPNPTIYGDNKFDIHCNVHIIDYEIYD